MEEEEIFIIKLLFVGDVGVGKT